MARERTPEQLREWIRTGHPWKSKDMEELYAKVPEVWTFGEPDEIFRLEKVAEQVAQWFPKLNRDKMATDVLDAGCGKGRLTLMLAHQGFGYVQGVDISSTAIEYATKIHKTERVQYKVGDLREMSVAEEEWDIITPVEFFYFLTHDEASEVARKLVYSLANPGLIVMSDHMRKKKWSIELFTKHGLKVLHETRYSHDASNNYSSKGQAPIPSKQGYRVVTLGKGI